MVAAGVPTAPSESFTDLDAARRYVAAHAEPLVVKASGLAAGKGAIVCATRAEARAAVEDMLGAGTFGEAGRTVVVEAFLQGEELSVLALASGDDVRLLPPAQDHKRIHEGDRGPNTGGMGAYSPVAIATPALLRAVSTRVIEPTLAELARRDAAFSGVLYAGLMIGPSGDPQVIEFNCRFGDPEAQAILPRVDDGLLPALVACAQGAAIPAVSVTQHSAVTTVLAARGYPDQPEKGAAIVVPDDLGPGTVVFHAGTRVDEHGALRVSGGRVLAVTGVAETFVGAQAASRSAALRIELDGKQFRADIGWREASRHA
jgi:phosphoribosylamine--glycine ligase